MSGQSPNPESLTPVEYYPEVGWWAKREDLACYDGPDWPRGSKMRQFYAMAKSQKPGLPCVVGCSANGSMQCYLTAAAKKLGVPAHVFVPSRRKRTPLTEWCEANGAQIHYTSCGWPAYVKKEARTFAKTIGGGVRWDRKLAVADTARQVQNIPSDVLRIVVIAGSGLTALAIALGLLHAAGGSPKMSGIKMLLVDVCGIVDREEFIDKLFDWLPPLSPVIPEIEVVTHRLPYGRHMTGKLPNGEPLDVNYAAKCLEYMRPGDCLWVSGIRPLSINK